MSKGGYNKLLTKLQESNVENLRLQGEIADRNRKIAQMQSDEKEGAGPAAGNKESKLSQVWTSTPLWSSLSMLCALVVSPLSAVLAYVMAWATLSGEFIRIRVSEDRTIRYISNALFGALLGIAIILAWPLLPKPKEEPDWDKRMAAILAKNPPSNQTTIIENPSPPEHSHMNYRGIKEEMNGLNMAPANIVPGVIFNIPLAFGNTGDFPVETEQDAHVVVTVANKDLEQEFRRARKAMHFSQLGPAIPARADGGYLYHTEPSPNMTEEMERQFLAGKLSICAFGAVKWKDATGWYETDKGECAIEEPDGGSWNWHAIRVNNKETKLK